MKLKCFRRKSIKFCAGLASWSYAMLLIWFTEWWTIICPSCGKDTQAESVETIETRGKITGVVKKSACDAIALIIQYITHMRVRVAVLFLSLCFRWGCLMDLLLSDPVFNQKPFKATKVFYVNRSMNIFFMFMHHRNRMEFDERFRNHLISQSFWAVRVFGFCM